MTITTYDLQLPSSLFCASCVFIHCVYGWEEDHVWTIIVDTAEYN